MLNGYAVNGAKVNGTFLDVTVRSIVYGYASALATPIPNSLDGSRRFIVDAQLAATGSIIARAFSRSPDPRFASADAIVIDRALRGNPSSQRFAEAAAFAQANSFYREYHRDPAFVDASAWTEAVLRAGVRSPVFSFVEALGAVVANSEYAPGYDEPALEENTFVVRYEPNVFVVR